MNSLYQTTSEADTLAFASALAKQLKRGDCVLLQGDLGVGKSVMARGIARHFGVKGPMPSPSFTMLIPYQDGTLPIYHYDLYRLRSVDEFYDAGLDEYIGGNGICLIEWPQTIDLNVSPALLVEIAKGGEETIRSFRLKGIDLSIDESLLQRWKAS